jgi:ATP-dependent Lon protease
MHILIGKPDEEKKEQENNPNIPKELPILPLRGIVVYPLTIIPLSITQDRDIRLVDEVATSPTRLIGVALVQDAQAETIVPENIAPIATVAVIHRLLRMPDNTVRLIVQGLERIRIHEYVASEPYLRARVEAIPDVNEKTLPVEALMRNTIELLRRLAAVSSGFPEEFVMAALNIEDPRQLVYLVATGLRLDLKEAYELLALDQVADKLTKLNGIINKELEVLELGKKIQSQAQGEMEKNQREYILREQMRQIKKELGEEDEQAAEVRDYEKKIADAQMPAEAEKEAKRELNRMKSMPPAAAEYSVIKTYLDWLVDLPWNKATADNLDIPRARQILDEDHYDLKEVKERLLEYLSVRKLRLERGGDEEAKTY